MKSEMYKEAKRLYMLGFGILLLHPKSKRPINMGWTTGERELWTDIAGQWQDGMNIGVRLGQASRIGEGYLACIDVDIKDPAFKAEALAFVKTLVGDKVLPEVRSGAGGGSRHLYCLTREPFKMVVPLKRGKDVGEVAVYSTGRQMVLPPSIHPDTGKTYEWRKALTDISELPMLSFDSVESDVAGSARGEGKRKSSEAKATNESGVLTFTEFNESFEVEDVDLAWLPIPADIMKGIKDVEGVSDRSGYLLRASSALLSAGLNRNEVLSVLTCTDNKLSECAYEHAKTRNRAKAAFWVYKFTLKKVSDERDASKIFARAPKEMPVRALTAEEAEKQAAEFKAARSWKQDLDRGQHGFRSSLKNLDKILSHSVEGDIFVKDLFANRIIYGTDAPWGRKSGISIEDIDLLLVKRWLADTEFRIEPNTNAILEATSLVADRCAVHPVRDYLSNLVWDGVPRVNTWIKDYCQGRAEEPYLSEVSRKFLLALVKRVFEPGCQWDYVLVLEGQQGKYKSSLARALAGDKWFMDNLPDLKDKDAMLNLQGKWLIELAELTNTKRADYNLVKAYLVRRFDTVRPHYGRLMAEVPRQSVFIGTVNEGEYLKDPTGNRRFWPVKVGDCDVEGITKVRDQLFAEAMHIYKTENEVLMLGEKATLQALAAQDDRRVDDDETEMREELVRFMHSDEAEEFNFKCFRSRELFEGPHAPWRRWTDKSYSSNTASHVLRVLGFERRKIQGQRIWGTRGNVKNMGCPSGAPCAPDEEIEDFF